jgi:hypothetical protein
LKHSTTGWKTRVEIKKNPRIPNLIPEKGNSTIKNQVNSLPPPHAFINRRSFVEIKAVWGRFSFLVSLGKQTDLLPAATLYHSSKHSRI